MPAQRNTPPPSRGELASLALDTLTAQQRFYATPRHSAEKADALRTSRHLEARLRRAASAALSAECQHALPGFGPAPSTRAPATPAELLTRDDLYQLRDLVAAAGRQSGPHDRGPMRTLYRKVAALAAAAKPAGDDTTPTLTVWSEATTREEPQCSMPTD